VSAFGSRAERIRDEYERRLRVANEAVDIFGFGLSAFREDYGAQLDELARRVRLRILMIHPALPTGGKSLSEFRDAEEGNSPGTIARDVRSFADLVRPILETPGLDIQVRLYRCLPLVNIFRIDDELFWGPYLIGGQSRNSPTFLVQKGGMLFGRMMEHYNLIWKSWSDPLSVIWPDDHSNPHDS
jgi:hypothetical protein